MRPVQRRPRTARRRRARDRPGRRAHEPRTGRPDGDPIGPLPGAVTCLAIDRDTLVAGCADGTVRRWTGTRATVTGLPGPVTALAAHAGAVYAAVGDTVQVIR